MVETLPERRHRSAHWFSRAERRLPGGVNSPVRAFGAVGGTPLVVRRANGAYLTDVDGRRYVDYVMSWGPLITGHRFQPVIRAVHKQLRSGISFGTTAELEIEFSELIASVWPTIEKIRMVSSGTEATMSALRLARGVTGRSRVIKFSGCYHGHADGLLVKGGSGLATFGTSSSAGVPERVASLTSVAEYNDLESVRRCFRDGDGDVAAVIVEPVAGNMGLVPPQPGFLEGLRALCDQHQSILIFDEVMTGFRLSLRGAEGLYGVTPDLICLGKIIGGGLPCGAYGGRAELLNQVSPLGPVYQAGTLSGNPVVMAAGKAMIRYLKSREEELYSELDQKGEWIQSEVEAMGKRAGVPMLVQRCGSMFTIFFTESSEVRSFADVKKTRVDLFPKFFHGLLSRGVYLPPAQYEAAFLSTAHGEVEIRRTLKAIDATVRDFS